MPEGDTIYRTAVTLRSVIEGHNVTEAISRDTGIPAAQLIGQRLVDVEARGKHLLMHFEPNLVLHSHMGMTGSWHLYNPGEAWRKPERRAAIVLEFDHAVAVCFSPKILELLTTLAMRRHRYLRQLGPDILARTLDEAEVVRRFRIHSAVPIGQAILNQTILCGVGNVYKSEVLFIRRMDPFRPVAESSDAELQTVIGTARELMHKNLEGYPRQTRFAGDRHRKWVYGRHGEPCFVCGTLIEMQRQGDLGRSTYFCRTCQIQSAERKRNE